MDVIQNQLFSRLNPGKQIYRGQVDLLKKIDASENTIVVKPRRIFGVDTAMLCYMVQKAISPEAFTAVISCHNQEAVYDINFILEKMLECADIEFSRTYNPDRKEPGLYFDNGTILIRHKTPLSDIQSIRPDLCYFSEAAFIENLEELVLAADSVLAPGGKMVAASTQNWENTNLFSDLLLPENEGSRWEKIILDWRDHDVFGTDPGWAEKTRRGYGITQHEWDKEYEPLIQFA
jgi:hypothetical protein